MSYFADEVSSAVKHTMYVLSFIHCHEMRRVFVFFVFLSVNSAVLCGSIIFKRRLPMDFPWTRH